MSIAIRSTITRNAKWTEIDINSINMQTAMQYAEVFDFKIDTIVYNANTNTDDLIEALQKAKVWEVLTTQQ